MAMRFLVVTNSLKHLNTLPVYSPLPNLCPELNSLDIAVVTAAGALCFRLKRFEGTECEL